MKKYLILFIILKFSLSIGQAQTKNQDLATAEKSLLSKNYYDALVKFKKISESDPKDINYLYKTAEAARLFNSFALASEYYSKVLEHNENLKYPLASFYKAQMLQIQGDYNSARQAYNLFKASDYKDDGYYLALAEKEIQACDWAIEKVKNPVKGTTVNRLGDHINSIYSDFGPSLNGEDFYFSSLRFENTVNKSFPKRHVSNILISHRLKDEAKKLNFDILNKPGSYIANSCFNGNKSKVFFTICEDINEVDKHCEIYMANVDSVAGWNNLLKLPAQINLPDHSQTQPSIGFDRETNKEILYFASNRDGGKGGYDIWYSIINNETEFSTPVNFAIVNTAQDDITPSYNKESKTFYYSSKGHLGLGGFDIYSVKENTQGWGEIKHMGVPINSSYDDIYFIKSEFGNNGYLASNRTGAKYIDDINQACCLDLFDVIVLPSTLLLKALVFDAITQNELLGSTIKLFDLSDPGLPPVIITKNDSNLFNFPIDADKQYRIEASKPGYFSDSTSFYSGIPGEFKEIIKKLYLKQKPVKLKVLTFDKQTSEELIGTEVTLVDLDTPSRAPIVINSLQSNLTQFDLERCHHYKIIASKKDYGDAIKLFTVDCNTSDTITEKLYLNKFLYSLLPLKLYFDNDRPNPGTISDKSSLSYDQTYKGYYARKAMFIKNFEKINSSGQNRESPTAMETFFESDVKGGREILDKFLNHLKLELERGKKYEIFLKGYASPLAKNDYNEHLGKRRIQSVRNEFMKYNKGMFRPYLKNGQLVISEKSFGEETSPKDISDNPSDLRSIYNVDASKERRVEIIEIKE